jgi:putative phosphoesterase
MGSIAVISDIHGNITALDAVLAELQSKPCDIVLCTGDLVGYGPRPNEVIERIRSLDIPTVMGNYDEAVGFKLPACGCHIDDPCQKQLSNHSLKWSFDNTSAGNREFLRSLPEALSLDLFGKKIMLIHASSDSISEYIYEADDERISQLLEEMDEDIYIYGHTHLPFSKNMGQKWLINAGSVGRPKDKDNRAGYIRLKIRDNNIEAEICRVPYDIEKVVADIEASGLDLYFGDFLRMGGDDKGTLNDSCVICNTNYNDLLH